ncbi:MAG: hypothetical protein GX868_01300 [Actinobacteria bacterium]|nr:hypothetical protein [Actinomycetota bacterium]
MHPPPRLATPPTRRHVIVGTATALLAEAGVGAGRWLNPAELERLARLGTGDAADAFLAAHVSVRRCVAALLGVPAHEVDIAQRCERCTRAHGKPRVTSHDDVSVSWSHAGAFVAAVASSTPVAVDIEPPARPHPVPALAFHPAELARIGERAGVKAINRWCEKECLVKLGLVALDDFAQLDLNDGYPGVTFEQLAAPGGAICVLATSNGP